jgi:Fe-S cluster assembly ATPase SufC
MFRDLVGKNVTAYLMSNPEDTYVIKGKVTRASETSTTIEIEERKKFGEMKKYQRTINNRYITFIDLVENKVEEKQEEKAEENAEGKQE